MGIRACGGLEPGHSGIGGGFASLAPLIYHADRGRRLKASLGLGVDRFLGQLVPAIEFSTIDPSRRLGRLSLLQKNRVRADSSKAPSASNPITYSAPDHIHKRPGVSETLADYAGGNKNWSFHERLRLHRRLIGANRSAGVEVILALQRTLTRFLLVWFQTIGLTLDECVHTALCLKVVFVSAPGIGAEVETTAPILLRVEALSAQAASLSISL